MLEPNIELSFNNPSYPFGRCINLGPGIRALNKTVEHVYFDVMKNNVSLPAKVQVLYKDPINGDVLKPMSFPMQGDSIKIETKPKSHFKKYKTKISLFEHVQGDPKFDCKHYSKEKSYGKCLEKELVAMFQNLLGCHPPFLTTRKKGVCNQKFNLTKEDKTTKNIYDILYEITNDFEPNSCKRPCRKFLFETQKLYENTRHFDINSIMVVFPKKVELIKTSFLTTVPNLLTGLGGAVSSGQTLMWLIVTLLGINTAVDRLKQLIRNYNR